MILEGFALNKEWKKLKWQSPHPGFVSSSMDIAGSWCVSGLRACWPSGEAMGMRMGRDGNVGGSRAEQHIQKVRRCLGIIIILPCQGYKEGHVEPGRLPPSTL